MNVTVVVFETTLYIAVVRRVNLIDSVVITLQLSWSNSTQRGSSSSTYCRQRVIRHVQQTLVTLTSVTIRHCYARGKATFLSSWLQVYWKSSALKYLL